jgi:putative transcriptional regulator
MSTKSSLMAQFGRRVRTQAIDRVLTGSRERVNLRPRAGFSATVSLARALIRRGVTGSLARHVAEQLLAGRSTPIWVPHYDGPALSHELDIIGVDLKTPEPISGEALAALRKDLHLSQEQFANSVGLELRTLQNWEQNRVAFDAPTTLLIKLLERYPAVVQSVAADEPVEAPCAEAQSPTLAKACRA